MVRYWVIAPYRNQRTIPGKGTWHTQGFKQAWEYAKENGVIAVGWYHVGDLTGASRNQIKNQYLNAYGKERGRGYIVLQRFWLDMKPGDRVIARYGLKKIVGLGTVAGNPCYDLEKGKEWAGELPLDPHPNFLRVSWQSYSHCFVDTVFQRITVSELKESHKHWPTVKETLAEVWNVD